MVFNPHDLDLCLLNMGEESLVFPVSDAMQTVSEQRSAEMNLDRGDSQHSKGTPLGISPWQFSPADRPRLRVGLLLDSPKLSRFLAKIVADIQSSNFAKLELLVYRKAVPKPAAAKSTRSSLGGLRRRLFDPKLRKKALYRLYLDLDRRMKPANHPLEERDCSDLLAGIESMEVEPIGQRFVHRFPQDAMDRIRAKNLDVLIRFGFNILHGDILKAARYGVWSYHHGDNDFYRGGPAHFWELHEGAPLSGVILQVLTEELDGGLVLCKSLFATRATISMSANRYAPYWGSTDFMIRKLNELHQFGWEHVEKSAVPRAPYQGKRQPYRTPTNLELMRWLAPVFLKKAARFPFRKRTVQHWQIAMRNNGKNLVENGNDLAGFRWLEAPPGHFWADPFGFEHDGKHWLFFEDFSYQEKRAVIRCARISPEGDLISPVVCLENPERHYSYPHVFGAGNDIFMVPESYDSERVDLFRCAEFPHKWVHERTLLQGRFVDTTIWQDDALWWMMTTRAEPDPRAGVLFLYYSDSLGGEWRFHRSNPISTDARNNRGAGRVFRAGDRLIRPSQSHCPIYGYSFSLNEIVTLTPAQYSERSLTTVTPEYWKGISGVHTYNRSGNIEWIDGARSAALKDVAIGGDRKL